MTKTVACLAGDGVGPELMAAATRALDRVAALHQFELDDRHLPFAGEAVTRSGHPLPPETRAGYRDVDAILVASPDEPAFAGVKADLQLAWRVVRVHVDPTHDVVVAGPVGDWANETAVGARVQLRSVAPRHASSRSATRTRGGRRSPRERARWDGLDVEEATLGEALVRLRDDAVVARRDRDRDASRRRPRRCRRRVRRLAGGGRARLAPR